MFGSYEVSGQRPEQATKIPFWYSLPIPERFLVLSIKGQLFAGMRISAEKWKLGEIK